MRMVHTVRELRVAVQAARQEGKSVGLVPTMGALHAGHMALVERARHYSDFVVVSVFVNPTQFGPGEDYEEYPRTMEEDAAKCAEAGVDLLYAPSVEEMYPEGGGTVVHVERLGERLCGAHRPGHFDGVTTVVAKLFNQARPDAAFFGEKDYQQLSIIRRMVGDLDIPVEVVGVETVREEDGLALSSRNQYLTEREREVAPKLREALEKGAEVVRGGGSAQAAREAAESALAGEPSFRVQYLEVVDAETLEPKTEAGAPAVIVVAAHLGSTRLIDNIIVE